MARTNTLTNFLEDVSNAIKQKTGNDAPIPASQFDREILSIETPGIYQEKQIELVTNGNYVLSPDDGFDAISKVHISVDVQGGGGGDTSDATATPLDIIAPKTAYARGQKLTGAIQESFINVGIGATITNSSELTNNLMSAYNKDGLMIQRDVQTLKLYTVDEFGTPTLVKTQSSFFETSIIHSKKLILTNPVYENSQDGVKDYIIIYTTSTYDGAANGRFDWSSDKVDTIRFAKLHYENTEYTITKFSNTYTNTNTGVDCTGWIDLAIHQTEPAKIFVAMTHGTNTNSYGRHISTFWLVYNSETGLMSFTKQDGGRFLTNISNWGSDCKPHALYVALQSDGCYHVIASTKRDTGNNDINRNMSVQVHNIVYSATGSYVYSNSVESNTYSSSTPIGIPMENRLVVARLSSRNLTLALYTNNTISSAPSLLHTYTAVVPSTLSVTPTWLRLERTKNMLVVIMGDYNSLLGTFLVYVLENDELSLVRSFSLLLTGIQSQNGLNYIATGTDGEDKIYIPSNYGLTHVTLLANNKIRIKLDDGNASYYNTYDATGVAGEILLGKKVYNKDGPVVGTMPNNGAVEYTPSTSPQMIANGFHNGSYINAVTNTIDNNIIPENIRNGVTILGVDGTFEGSTGGDATSDGNLQAKHLLEGYSAVVDGEWIVGTMKNYGERTMIRTSVEQTIPSGYYSQLIIPIAESVDLDGYEACELALQRISNDVGGE